MPMPTNRNTNLSPLYAMLAFLVIICLSVLSKWGVLPAVNDVAKKMLLQDIKTVFQKVQHPDQTQHVHLQKTIGLLTELSESCDIFIGEVRSYSGERDQILATYAGQTVQGYGKLGVIFIEDKTIPVTDPLNLPTTFNSLPKWNIAPASLEQPLYLVYIFIRDYNSKTKIDCK